MCACRVGKVVCVCGAGEGCSVVWDSVVWHGVVLICGVWLSSCVREVGEGCDGIVVWVSFGLCVHCWNTTLWGFFISFLLKFGF